MAGTIVIPEIVATYAHLVAENVNYVAARGNVLGALDFGLNAQFTTIASAIGFPMDQVRYIILLVLMYPLGALHRFVPGAALKHLIGAILGLWICQLCFGDDWIHPFLSSTVAFVLMHIPSKNAHLLVWIWMMGYMSGSHIYRMYTSYLGWDLDYTGPQMILTQKLTSLAFSYYDGVYNKKATEEQKARAQTKLPSVLEYFGYVYFHVGFLAGPAFDFSEYMDYIKAKDSPAGRKFAAFGTLAYSLLCFAVYVGMGLFLPQFNPAIYSSDKWMTLPFVHRVGYMWVIAFVTRMRYYFAWLLAEGACVLTGLGYNEDPKTKQGKWDALRNADPIAFETATNIRECSVGWNMLTSRWLKRTVYERVPKKFSTVATYAVSAFWHGFYPGYYMFFLTVGIFNEVPADARRKIRPMILGTAFKPAYDVLTWFLTTITINYWVMSFLLLDFQKALNFWRSMYFYGHILPIPLFILLKFIRAPRPAAAAAAKPDETKKAK